MTGVLIGLSSALNNTDYEINQATASALVQDVANRNDAQRQIEAKKEQQQVSERNKKNEFMSQIQPKRWSLTKGSQEFGVEPKTLRSALERAGIRVERGKLYTSLEIACALWGDVEKERAGLLRAQRIAAEAANAEAARELVRMAEVEELYTQALLPVRQRLLSLPSEAASRCNPTDPQFAREALQRWLDDALPLIREKLPKAKAK